jgi:hypothetical protein
LAEALTAVVKWRAMLAVLRMPIRNGPLSMVMVNSLASAAVLPRRRHRCDWHMFGGFGLCHCRRRRRSLTKQGCPDAR